MKIILWGMTALLTAIPLVMYLVYSIRRLGTRRQLLLQTLLTLGLDDAYMRIRHGEYYAKWCELDTDARIEELQSKYFNPDFKSETSHPDYLWPVALITVLSALGWYIVLGRFYPEAGLAQLSEKVPPMFVWGFVGAYLASLLSIIDDFRKYSLLPSSYYSLVYRLLFSSTAAFLVGQLPNFDPNSGSLVAFGIGLIPMEKTWAFITEKASQKVGIGQPEGELGADLAAIQGLEDSRNRKKLVDIGITSVQSLATADPLLLFFQTTFPMRTIMDMVDKAILYLYIGDKAKDLRSHGINGVIELRALARLIEKTPAFTGGQVAAEEQQFSKFFQEVNAKDLIDSVAAVLGQSPDELKAFIYNMYYDPVVIFIYDVWGRYLNFKALEEPGADGLQAPVNPLADKPVDQPPDKPVDQPPDKPADHPPDKPADQPPDKPVDQPPDKPVGQPPDKPVDQPDQPPNKPEDQPPDKPADQLSDGPPDKEPGSTAG